MKLVTYLALVASCQAAHVNLNELIEAAASNTSSKGKTGEEVVEHEKTIKKINSEVAKAKKQMKKVVDKDSKKKSDKDEDEDDDDDKKKKDYNKEYDKIVDKY